MKKIAALILSLAMLLALSACGSQNNAQGSAASGGDGATIVLRASHSCANTHPYQLGLERFAELVKEKTNGAVEIDIFHSAQLGDERANIEDLQMGTLDIAVSSTGPLGNFVEDFLSWIFPSSSPAMTTPMPCWTARSARTSLPSWTTSASWAALSGRTASAR